ncbi:putative GntR family transcriptional regulator [Ilumatobacter coccineus YM16-304]|uniref:Putative GntR family transcriptional regulator n=1 Tax=Ilumatobacter coccineus (strain NBRC 103263 / KCTC 29153 / YM16-304) TaxID=1313172 RepID=A0A6C7E4U4_ILUCY|nr:putative GntR family transcriptional regulator [Ilumatobacter coccineus YM16-304]
MVHNVGVISDDGDLVDRLRRLLSETVSGDRTLPGEPSLAAALGASRPSVREAMTRLEAEGLVSRRRGQGTTVNRDAHRLAARFDQQVEFADVIAASGRTPAVELLEASATSMAADTATMLGADEGDRCFRTVKRWTADGCPVMVAIDEFALGDTAAETIDVDQSLFVNVAAVSGHEAEWEIAQPSAMIAQGDIARWAETDGALLTLDLLGVSRDGDRLYRAREYHVPGAVDFGFVRTFGA